MSSHFIEYVPFEKMCLYLWEAEEEKKRLMYVKASVIMNGIAFRRLGRTVDHLIKKE